VQVKGKTKIHARQIALDSSAVHSFDVYILDPGKMNVNIWNGRFASRQKRETALVVANRMNSENKAGMGRVLVIEEGEGGDNENEFWEVLGGLPTTITTGGRGGDEEDEEMERKWMNTDRLFRIDMQTRGKEDGLFEVEPLFTKDKLNSNYCYILDCHAEMYLWRGDNTSEDSKRKAFDKAVRMFKSDKTRPKWAVLKKVNEGKEPVLFQSKFHGGWELLSSGSESENNGGVEEEEESGGGTKEEIVGEYDKYLSYEQLSSGKSLPASVDKNKKEWYLSDEEFEEVFEMTKEEFYSQPEWKKVEDKKRVNLF